MTNAHVPLLQTQDVYKSFTLPGKKELRAVNGVSLELNAGECLAIVGESGSGKSTLARMIARIESVSSGVICFEGESVGELEGEPLRMLRRRMQMIFQDPSTVFSPRMRIGEFMREPFLNYKMLSKKEAVEKARELLVSVELPDDFVTRFPHQLSGGELQRVAIARAMGMNPQLLICDEPTSALDVSIQKHIIDLLGHVRREYGVSMLFITHDLALASGFCDRIAVMYMGYVLESLPGAHLHRDALHPYTHMLLQSVFHVGKERGERIEELDGEPPSSIDLPPGCPFSWNCPNADDVCLKSAPVLREVAPGHHVACSAVTEHSFRSEELRS